MKRCPLCMTVYSDDANFCPMDSSHLEAVAHKEAPPPSLDLPTMQARLIGARFQLGPQIGGRRTGEVYSAEDITTGQACAVKIILPAVFPTPLVAQRTERELKQLMKVSSDRITKVIEVGKTGDRLYVALELVSGVTLAEIIANNGAIPPDQAARLGVEIGEGLAEASKVGVIHRDVSPKNFLVIADTRGNRRVKILDFGIPTPVTDKVLGIPEFLSPEQAEGKPVDQRSNIYSMGALLYTMLTGTPPFMGTTEEVLRQQISASPVPPSQKSPRAGITPELERLIMKALEKASSRRHLTLRQLLGELETIAGHLPVTHPVSLGSAAPAPVRSSGEQRAQRTSGAVAVPRVAQPIAADAPAIAHVPPRRERSAASKTIVGIPFSPSNHPPPATQSKQQPAVTPPVEAHAPIAAAAPQPHPPAEPIAPPAVTFRAPEPERPPEHEQHADEGGEEGGGKRRFRETMWFKKGEAEEADEAEKKPIEDRYKDDGTITAADRERLSLRSAGAKPAPAPVPAKPVVPGEAISDDELAREFGAGSNRMMLYVGVGAAIAVALILIYFLFIH